MPDLLVISLLIIGPVGIWLLMRYLNKDGGAKPQ
jgi:ABC-type nickel/cobalt efflux system permease component RcnA